MLGVFDSGVGGLTVVRALQKALPDIAMTYLGDTARFPYGSKSAQTIQRFSRENVEWLLARGANVIVVACHTASSVAADMLRLEYQSRGVPVFDVVGPGLDEALSVTHGHIGIIGTRGTVASGAHAHYLKKKAPETAVNVQACPLLAPLVEEGLVNAPETRSILERYLAPLIDLGIDTLVLGCTHYPPLRPLIEELLPEGVRVIDPADATAAYVQTQLAALGLLDRLSGEGRLEVFLSDVSPALDTLGPILFGHKLTASVAENAA